MSYGKTTATTTYATTSQPVVTATYSAAPAYNQQQPTYQPAQQTIVVTNQYVDDGMVRR